MKKLYAFLALIGILATPAAGYAFEWDGNNTEKRVLNVCLHRSLTSNWREWAKEAMELWNNESETTGWTVREAPFIGGSCEVFLLVQELDESTDGAFTTLFLDEIGLGTPPNGTMAGMIAMMNADLELTKSWLPANQDNTDGLRDGWSTADEFTYDPIDVLAHIFSRAMRVQGSEQSESISANVSDKRLAGQHLQNLTTEDIERAKNAANREEEFTSESITTTRANTLELDTLELQIPSNNFETSSRAVTVNINSVHKTTNLQHQLNDIESLNEVKGIFFSSEPTEPIEVTWKLAGESSTDPAVYLLEKRIWDVTPVEVEQNPSIWRRVSEADVDLEQNEITFSINSSGYYAIGVPGNASNDQTYVQVRNNTIRTEKQLGQQKMIHTIAGTVAKQLPAFFVGFFSAIAIMLITKKKREPVNEPAIPQVEEVNLLPQEERDRNSVSDVEGIDSTSMRDEDRGRGEI